MILIRSIVVLLSLSVVIALAGRSSATETSYKQVATVIKFYETLAMKTPTVQQFFELFGRENEAELELILRQEFPSLNPKGNWFHNQKAKRYVDEVYNHPGRLPSRFLRCIKLAEPSLFSSGEKRLLEFPPSSTKDFRRFNVLTKEKGVIFEFSQNECTLENVYLPSGKSIYTLISRCVKSK